MVGLGLVGLVVYQTIIEPPQLTLLDSVLDWVVAIKWNEYIVRNKLR